MKKSMLVAVMVLAFVGAAQAAEPAPGDKMLADYFKAETAKLQDACLADVDSLAEWEAKKPELRRQLFEMLGLDPLPEKSPLNPVVTGTTDLDEIIVERLYFESRPGLYVTANFYRPKEQAGPLPAILYVCGHSTQKKNGVSYGNKAGYHHHGAWFARNGYVCLTIDTLQLGEIEGIHHGTHRLNRWWWNSRGYTPAGVEAWNSIRALDYLQSRPEVDGEKIGVTGRSGGGAYSWFIAAIDERIKAAVPVAGITDLENHVVDGCVEGHCDCMFFVNTYRWDYPLMAALVAPQPLLISNTDKDRIFPLDGVVRTHALTRKIYDLYDADRKLGLHITEGPHKDTQELRIHAFVWFDRFLKGEERVIDDPAEKFLEPEQLNVFTSLPGDELNTRIDEVFVPTAGEFAAPTSAEEWSQAKEELLAGLRSKTFRGWPAGDEPLDVKWQDARDQDGLIVQAFEFTGQGPFRLPLWVVSRSGLEKPAGVTLDVLSEADWPAFAVAFGLSDKAGSDAGRFAAIADELEASDRAVAFFAPRGVGPTAWTDDAKERTHIRRRFMLLGQTLAGMRAWDTIRAVQAVRSIDALRDVPVSLSGTGDAAVAALYASLFTSEIAGIELADVPASHREGPDLLNVLRVLDVPQTVALAAERCPVVLRTDQPEAWSHPQSVAEKLGWGAERVQIESTQTAASQ